MKDDAREILAMEARRQTAIEASDTDTLRALSAPDYVHIDVSGRKRNRDEFLDELANGTRRYTSYETKALEVALHGDAALVTGIFNNIGTTAGGTRIGATGHFVRVYFREAGGWVNMLHQATATIGSSRARQSDEHHDDEA